MSISKYQMNISLQQSDDESDQENENKIDNQVVDEEILDKTNVTFTSFIKTTFKIENINKEIKIAISKFELNQLKSFCSELNINLHYAQDYIEVETDILEEKEGDLLFLKKQVTQYFQQYYSTQLNFDIDDQRAIQTSNLLINELQKNQIYLIRMRSIDQKISLYLVSKAKNLQVVATNMQNRLRGIRIFFQDCVGYMTKLHKNRDFKECLTKLRQTHYQKTLRNKIEQDFQNIVFQDVIDKNNTFSSLIIGFNLPYYMQGKKDICQQLFRYISTQIQSQLALFIQFPYTQECLSLANKLVNITNDAKETNFYCSSQVFLGINSVGIIGHPKDLITLIDSHLSPKHEDFDKSQEFIQGLKIGILEKNFCHTIGDQIISIDRIEKILQKKPEVELIAKEQLKLIRIKEKIKFKSYCNLLKFICDQKIKLCTEQTENKLQLAFEYISQKLAQPQNDKNFFEIIQQEIEFKQKNSQDKNSNPSQTQLNQQNKNQNQYPSGGNQNRNEDYPRNQNRNGDHPRNQNRNQDPPRNQDRNNDNQRNQDRNSDNPKNQNRNQDHPRNQNRNQDHPNNLLQSQNQSSAQSQKSTEDLNQFNNNTQQIDSSNEDSEEQQNVVSFINKNQNIEIDVQEIQFQSPIIKQLKEQNQRFVVLPEYKKYFQKLIGQDINLSISYEQNEKIKNYFICLDKDEIFKIKCFKKNIKIYEKIQDAKQSCLGEKNMRVIEVMVNQQAEKDNQIDEENMNNSYFYTTQDNQIYPIRQKE